MKTKLLISDFEYCTDHGLWSKGIADNAISTNNFIIRNIGDNTAQSLYDEYLSPITSEVSSGIDTIIYHTAIDRIDYNSNYKNIVIINLPHFIKYNRSILDKLSIADEIWTFDQQHKDFLGANLQDKTKVVGYPYPIQRISNLFDNKSVKKDETITFYAITDITNIENIEILIYNFLFVFNAIDIKLIIYIKNTSQDDIDHIVKKTMNNIRSQFRFIDTSILDDMVTVLTGNPYINANEHTECHSIGDCYINIEHIVSPDLLTSSYLGKYILSIIDIEDTIKYHDDCKILTYPSNYRVAVGDNIYYNEFNSFPKINDISLQNKLVEIYKKIKNNINPNSCYELFNRNNLFNISKELT